MQPLVQYSILEEINHSEQIVQVGYTICSLWLISSSRPCCEFAITELWVFVVGLGGINIYSF